MKELVYVNPNKKDNTIMVCFKDEVSRDLVFDTLKGEVA